MRRNSQTLLLVLLPLYSGAFVLPRTRQASLSFLSRAQSVVVVTPLSGKRDGDDEEEQQAGMAEAFRELDSLKSLDDDDNYTPKKKPSSTPLKSIEKNVTLETAPKATPEAEVELYKDMYHESEKEDVELYADMLTDMGGTPPKPKSKQRKIKVEEEERVELLDSLERTPQDMEVFMNKALQEALKEAKSKTPDELASIDPLDDEEMMEEIKQVFEKANDELLASLEDIRKEQVRQNSCSHRLTCTLRLTLFLFYYILGRFGKSQCRTKCTSSNGRGGGKCGTARSSTSVHGENVEKG